MDAEALVDAIYEAAVIGERWPRVLETMEAHLESTGVALFSATSCARNWTASPGFQPVFEAYLAGGWDQRNDRAERYAAGRFTGFVTEADLFGDAFEQDALAMEFLKPRGGGREIAIVFQPPHGDRIGVTIQRPVEAGVAPAGILARAETLRPHLARAATVSARLGLELARAQAEALALLGLPAAVVTLAGRLVAANDLLAARIPDDLRDGARRLALADPAADGQFADALGRLRAGVARGASFPLRGGVGLGLSVAHLTPVRRDARDIFGADAALLIVTPLAKGVAPGEAILQGLFDLSPAEARVARAIGEAVSVSDIAIRFEVTEDTVRSHVKRVLAKTGTRRQAEVASLLAGVLRLPEPGEPD